jgi:hypothetical protein
MQTILVILTFSLAAGFLLKKFVWNPLIEKKRKKNASFDGNNTKCGNNDCGCH